MAYSNGLHANFAARGTHPLIDQADGLVVRMARRATPYRRSRVPHRAARALEIGHCFGHVALEDVDEVQ